MVWVEVVAAIAFAGLIGSAIWYRQERRLLLLAWRPTSSPLRFLEMCRRYLCKTGWSVSSTNAALADFLVTRGNLEAFLICRASGWAIGPDFLTKCANLRGMIVRSRALIIVVHEALPEALQETARTRNVEVVTYKALRNLEDLIRRQVDTLAEQGRSGPARPEKHQTSTAPSSEAPAQPA